MNTWKFYRGRIQNGRRIVDVVERDPNGVAVFSCDLGITKSVSWGSFGEESRNTAHLILRDALRNQFAALLLHRSFVAKVIARLEANSGWEFSRQVVIAAVAEINAARQGVD